MTLEQILRVPTAAAPEDRAEDVWDDENRCSYSADGEKLLDAENFPPEVAVREGCRILCDEAFAFQDYMAEDRIIGEEIPLEERFVQATQTVWEHLIRDPLIYDLVWMDSRAREEAAMELAEMLI